MIRDPQVANRIPATASVGTTQLVDNSVTEAKLASNAVTYSKLAPQTIITFSTNFATTYTPVNSDKGKIIIIRPGGTSANISVPINTSLALVAGERIDFIWGAGTAISGVTFSASSTSVHSTPGLKLRAQHSAASLICVGTNIYYLVGDLSA